MKTARTTPQITNHYFFQLEVDVLGVRFWGFECQADNIWSYSFKTNILNRQLLIWLALSADDAGCAHFTYPLARQSLTGDISLRIHL